jgi:proline iminopeptidase
MTLTKTLTTLAVALALGACTAPAPEPEEAPMPEGLTNGTFVAPLNGFEIHYEVHGQGPVLMTLPNSWGLSLEGLRAMYQPLEDRLTMVYFDPRGMGGSAEIREDADMGLAAVRADFQALREYLGLETVSAIGWSNGAVNLMWLAHEHPETLSAAIFVSGMASFTEEDMAAIAEAHPEMMATYTAFLEKVSDPDLSAEAQTALLRTMWMDEYFPLLFADPETAQAHLANTLGQAELSWPHAAYADKEASTFDARDLLPEIPVRSLVIAGAHDLLPPERVKALADGLPNAEFVVFENSGHFSPVEEPERFKEVIFDFLGVGSAPRAP